MIDELQVSNYALITEAEICFAPGFTVLTGETGAGKTALVGAIKLLIGERADLSSISDGTDELRVSARLIDSGGEETIVTRRLNRSGRSRAGINDEMVTVTALAEQIGSRFDLLGQHEHQSLLSTAAQLTYLDRFAGEQLSEVLQIYQQAWHQAKLTRDELSTLETASMHSSRNLEEARFVQESISAINPKPGEYEQLLDDLPILRSGEDLAYGSNSAWELLRAEDQALDLLASAGRTLTPLAGIDTRLDDLVKRLDSAQIDLDDVAAELLAYRDSVSFDAQALQQTFDRLGLLEGLMRRYGPRMEDVFTRLDQANSELSVADNLPELLEAARKAAEHREQELILAAGRLGDLRNAAANSLAAALTERLSELAFSGASIEVRIESLDRHAWTALTVQRFELLFRPSERSMARPLSKIASGGELSRVMLALKSELISDEGLTLVFDEVDAGIGGQAARAVADYLRRLADVHQVIVVTHLAQIAALADRQYVVQKVDSKQQTAIFEVSGEARVIELARMLSGSSDQAALDHARELLSGNI